MNRHTPVKIIPSSNFVKYGSQILTQKKHGKWRHPVAVVSVVSRNQQLRMNGKVALQGEIYDFNKSDKIFWFLLVCGVLFSSFKISLEKITQLYGPPSGVNKLGLGVQTNFSLLEKSPFIA